MVEKDKQYYINHPIFVKYKKKFDWLRFKRLRYMKKAFVNERIVEIPFVLLNLPLNKDMNILDLGCAESALSLYMASVGYRVTGVDMREFPYKHPLFTFVKADIMSLGFNDGSFDVVVCVSTLEHIGLGFYNDRAEPVAADSQAMQEIRRVLRDEGTLLLSVPFGVGKTTQQQRIYDTARLALVLEGFIVEEESFFANVCENSLNYWQQVSQVQAQGIDSADGSTQCICMIRAHKSGH